MKITPVTKISFQKLGIRKDFNNVNVPRDFIFRPSDYSILTVTTELDKDYTYLTAFNNDYETEPEAELQTQIYPDDNSMYINNMNTRGEYEGSGLGTGMHLTAIIEMLENGVKITELESAPSAIPFHTKLGFYPDGSWTNGVKTNINKISKDTSMPEYAQRAKELLNSEMSDDDKSAAGNNLIYGYTKKAIKVKSREEQEYLFTLSLPMVLSRKHVLTHKEFYNKLFDKYRIDYHID